MKVKTTQKSTVNPLDRISEAILKLGFSGGLVDNGRTKKEYHFSKTIHSKLVSRTTPAKKKGEDPKISLMRYQTKTAVALVVTLTVKDNSFVWKYDLAEQHKTATSQGLHSKLVAIFNKQPNE